MTTILKSCEIWYPKLDPKRPNSSFDKENPTWEVQIRTKDKNQKKEWEDLGLSTKLQENDQGVYYRVNLKRKSKKADGTDSKPVRVLNGKLEEIDPTSIGNGSIANVKIFQSEYENKGKKGIRSTLMALQITKHVVWVPRDMDEGFEETDTETVNPEGEADGKEDAF